MWMTSYPGTRNVAKQEKTEPLALTLLSEFCEELSKTWHWDIECRVDHASSLLCVYVNDNFLTCYSEFNVAHGLDKIKEELDGMVRKLVGY